jgi:hypothetical protein
MKKTKMLVLGLAAAGVLLGGLKAAALPIGQFLGPVPATETIAAGGTITANACGGIKRITSASDVTTDTTNTITAPTSVRVGCAMLIKNVGTKCVYMDTNTNFPVTTAASLAICGGGALVVWNDGAAWQHGAWTEF